MAVEPTPGSGDATTTPPPSVRLIRGVRDLVHGNARRAVSGVVVVGVLAWLAAGITTVDRDESGALLVFGRLADARVDPGLGAVLPGIERLVKVRTGEVFRVTLEGERAPELSLVTGDENLIETTLVVQYRVQDVGDYLFSTEDPSLLVEQTVRAALVEAFASTPVDDVLTSAKTAIQRQVQDASQAKLDLYSSGVDLVAVNLQTVSPPPEAAGAFRAVNDARAEAAGSVSVAEGAKERSLRLAHGEADQIVTAARATADTRKRSAQGRADRFASILRQHRTAPGPTRVEMWNEAIRQVLPRARLIFLEPGETPDVHVYLLPRADEPRRLTTPPAIPVEEP